MCVWQPSGEKLKAHEARDPNESDTRALEFDYFIIYWQIRLFTSFQNKSDHQTPGPYFSNWKDDSL